MKLCITLCLIALAASANGNDFSKLTAKELVEKLAISQQPAGMKPIFTPSVDTPKDDKRVIAYDAAKELENRGVAAFPALLASLNDHRQSVAFRAVIPHDVGFACYCLIQQQIEVCPEAYYYKVRKGADGQYHRCPDFLSEVALADWWASRTSKSLTELRLEALYWRIAEEKKIGFEDDIQRKEILGLLEKQREQLSHQK